METIDGTALAGEDYKPIKQLVTFAPQESIKDVFVEIVDDDVWEPDEFFYVRLLHDPVDSNAEDFVIGKVAINQVTIINDDGENQEDACVCVSNCRIVNMSLDPPASFMSFSFTNTVIGKIIGCHK